MNINYSSELQFKTSICTSGCLKSSSIGKADRFTKLKHNSECAKAVHTKLYTLQNDWKTELTIIELPDFSQDVTASVAMGMLWGVCSFLRGATLIEPNCLKEWSNSRRGDYKNKVIEMVLNRTALPANQIKNNNITDAVGIALLFSDLIYAHLQTYQKPTPPSSILLRLQGDDSDS